MSNRVVAWQIVSPDPDASTRFLQALFGWRATQHNALAYREVDDGNGTIQGGVWPAPPGVKPFVQLFVEVADIDSSIARAQSLQAKVIVPRTVLPEGNVMAVLLDPLGMPFVLCTAKVRQSEPLTGT
jgi:predicted enzyme related to lactoylglutathione lyase